MSGKELRSLSLSIGSALLPTFSLVSANPQSGANNAGRDTCFGKLCHPVDEYCSMFAESCMPCSSICDANTHNYHLDTCTKECSAYNSYEPLKAEIHDIQSKQNLILLLVSIIIILIAIRYLAKFLNWLQHKRCMRQLLSRLVSKPHQSNANGKDLNATTIQNLNAINRDIERAPSQIYSVAGAAEGSVVTLATPVSTRYPAENSTTPTTVVTEIGYGYGYDNQAMVVTPVAEKASPTAAF
ncbi:protein grindelwald [Drosophila grimshawi]|uniref:GH11212 n=1 Tax=Drosophila grimshawi TaxID=7222 RepID=B4JDL8_DROGR|nr:protein grindelwald [Drosophila grimshawi]EDW03388.1 GH11212 [Drosophila grimshawi]